ncbi:MAG: bifunctional phosphopantothenoylcysteine decarboxylase/phosphopantothenate--cysteine ligase CoaBC [Bacteroidales bacterium]|nr:bifunctional phosphopantothenoylcysteine decarboxylase/phosphopantothenate--cysteine ligase CoaBC [Bacteroidales bacterium]
MSLSGKKILLGISGSIAAYKAPLLIRLLKKEGVDVRVIMTPNAKDFVTPLTVATLSEHPVHNTSFNPNDGKWDSHVDLGRWADLFVIAPASANVLGKMAHGIADNHFMTTYLASKCPVYIAPAMDLDMYHHPTTQDNIKKIIRNGAFMIEAQEGPLASGLCGAGRMEEPEVIFEVIKSHFERELTFQGKKILVTAGPTYEAIDSVRFIGNYSSGRMGIALAKEFADRGAEVSLVIGPSAIEIDHPRIFRIDVVSAKEMYNACTNLFDQMDITVMSAAVADYTIDKPAEFKIKKSDEAPAINLIPTKDILAELGKQKNENQILIGFALETDNEIINAKKKLHNKNLDFIVLNSLKDEGAGFESKTNKISIISKDGEIVDFELKPKSVVALDIVDKVYSLVKNK